jgi:hypothetical protein
MPPIVGRTGLDDGDPAPLAASSRQLYPLGRSSSFWLESLPYTLHQRHLSKGSVQRVPLPRTETVKFWVRHGDGALCCAVETTEYWYTQKDRSL